MRLINKHGYLKGQHLQLSSRTINVAEPKSHCRYEVLLNGRFDDVCIGGGPLFKVDSVYALLNSVHTQGGKA